MRSLGLEPTPAQAAFLEDSGPRTCFAAGRGAGKSTAGLVLALHAALCGGGRHVLVVAPSPADAVGLYGRTVGMARRTGCGFFCRRSKILLSFEAGSTIRFMAGTRDRKSYRGLCYDLVVVDRAEMVPDEVKDALAGLLRHGSRLVTLEEI
jgi:tRNA(Met) C34 N-acetyltransferase TmcA